jgi:Bacterial SH3 domain
MPRILTERKPRVALIPLSLVLLFVHAAFPATVGDQIELRAAHQAGVPIHQEPRGTNDFQRIPDGTQATVTDTAKGGQWLKISLPDGRTGWIASRYGTSPVASIPSTGTSSAPTKPQRIEEGRVARVADGDTLTVITPNQTKLRIRMFGIDAPETPKGTKFPGQPYGPEAEPISSSWSRASVSRWKSMRLTATDGSSPQSS